MMPLALILSGQGYKVSGSDRGYDQGSTPNKFTFLQDQGVALFPQDGSGLSNATDMIVASAAIEDTVPDIQAAKALGIERKKPARKCWPVCSTPPNVGSLLQAPAVNPQSPA